MRPCYPDATFSLFSELPRVGVRGASELLEIERLLMIALRSFNVGTNIEEALLLTDF